MDIARATHRGHDAAMKRLAGMVALLALALAAMALHGGAPAAAQAAPEKGPIAIDLCRPTRGGVLCTQAEGVMHRVTTPSGNVITTTDLHQCIQVRSFAGQLLASRCEQIRRHDVFKQGEPQVVRVTSQGVRTFQGETCEFRSVMQIVMGEVRQIDLEEQCSAA